jgi:hypothetical protein
MQLYGQRYGVATREPHNVNVIVPKHKMQNAYLYIKAAGFKNMNAPPQGSGFRKLIQFHGVDLIPNNSNLAPKISKNHAVLLNNLYLLSPNNLIRQKFKTLKNTPEKHIQNLIRNNIKTLEAIRNVRGGI